MAYLALLPAAYLFSICIAHAVLLKRMLREPIRKVEGDWDELFPPFVALIFLMIAIALKNPRRYARVVGEAIVWPWVVFRVAQRALGGAPSDPTIPPLAPPVAGLRLQLADVRALLAAAGFPETPENLVAAHERLGILLALEVRALVAEQGTTADWERLVRAAGYTGRDVETWPQRLLDQAAAQFPSLAPRLSDLPARCRKTMLSAAGRGDGAFLSSDPAHPLPRATAWNLAGLTTTTASTTAIATASAPAVAPASPPAPARSRAAALVPAPRRSAPTVLPWDAVQLLAEYGRFRYDAAGYQKLPHARLSPFDWAFYQEFLDASQRDPSRFLRELCDLVVDREDFSTLGGARLTHEELDVDRHDPHFHRLMQAAIRYVGVIGDLDGDLTGTERDYLREHWSLVYPYYRADPDRHRDSRHSRSDADAVPAGRHAAPEPTAAPIAVAPAATRPTPNDDDATTVQIRRPAPTGWDLAVARLGGARILGRAQKVQRGKTLHDGEILHDVVCGDNDHSLLFAEVNGPDSLEIPKRDIISSNVKETNGSPTYRFYAADLTTMKHIIVYVDEMHMALTIRAADGH